MAMEKMVSGADYSPHQLQRQPSRTSNRVMSKPNYSNMSKGEGEVGDNLAYPNEMVRGDSNVGGAGAATG